MVTQKRRIETDQDRFGGFSSFNNNYSYFNGTSNTAGTTLEQQTFDDNMYTTYEEEQEVSTPTYESTTTYDGESEYSATDMVNEDNESEYAFVNTFMPNVERRETISSVLQSRKRKVHKTKIKLNARGKIFACMYSIVAILLVSFCIYNTVAIAGIKNVVAQKEIEYAQELSDVNLLQKDYEEISFTNGTSQSNFVEVNESNTVKVKIDKRPKFAKVDESTNWFDKVCNFFSNLF